MAEQIRDSQVIKTPEVVIDPRFHVPADVTGSRAALPGELNPEDYDFTDDGIFDPIVITDVGDTPEGPVPVTSLDTPVGISVWEQIATMTDDGTLVVDVILLVDDIEGATNYEVRINAA